MISPTSRSYLFVSTFYPFSEWLELEFSFVRDKHSYGGLFIQSQA